MGWSSKPQLHGKRVTAGLRTLCRREDAARIGLQTERPDLRAIGLGIDTETAGNRQAGLAETREIGGLGAEAGGVGGLGGGERNYEWLHGDVCQTPDYRQDCLCYVPGSLP